MRIYGISIGDHNVGVDCATLTVAVKEIRDLLKSAPLGMEIRVRVDSVDADEYESRDEWAGWDK